MSQLKVIITGATGMVGEGVLMECLQNNRVSEILLVNRKHYEINNPKVTELLVSDFMKAEEYAAALKGYDACFYCAGISSIGLNEADYTRITYNTTIHFAEILASLNPQLVFHYVTGGHTDSSENGKVMWARIKGRTENKLMTMSFKGQYNYRPGFMKPFKEQKNVKSIFKIFGFIFENLLPKQSLTLEQVGRAMINNTLTSYSKQILEIADIKQAAL